MMGAGKTAVARSLERITHLRAVDSDAEVERIAGRSVAEIWKDGGEAEFRSLESAAVMEVAANDGQVIATGGGVVTNPELMNALARNGRVVYLRAGAGALAERIGGAAKKIKGPPGQSRPLLAGAAGTDLEPRLEQILDERAAAYEAAADLTVDVEHLEPPQIAAQIANWWSS